MSAIHSVSSNTDNQWQLLQQLRASRAAETLAGTGAKATGASATAATPAAAVLPTGSSQSGAAGATGTASGTSGIFDTVAAKLMSGMQSFLVNMQSDSSTGTGSAGSVQGYGKSFTNAAPASATTGLSV